MITTHLKGGLGNQMFQIAAAYSLALDNNDKCAFFMGNKNLNQGRGASYYKDNVFKKLKELPKDPAIKPNYSKVRYMEQRFNYDPIPYRKGMVLQGFFQSEKYFAKHRKEILELFSNPHGEFKNSVAVHVRRGDYLNPFMAPFLPALPMDYYVRALADLDSKKVVEHIFIFSDDINWCKGNFSDSRITFVEGQEDYEDLYTAARCPYDIIANSSFSWWWSYLNTNINKIVYAPAAWFGPAFKDDWQDIYCKNWIKL